MNHKRSTQTGPGYEFLAFITREQLGVVSTAIFERVGYFTTPGEGLSVHGIDFIVYKPDGSEPEIALRCRPDSAQSIEMHEISRFWEKITGQGYDRGIFVTNKAFSEGALEFAASRDLMLVNAEGLKKGIAALPPGQSEAILMVLENRTEASADKKMKTVAVPDIALPGAKTKSAKETKGGAKVFRTPSPATRRLEAVVSEPEESPFARDIEAAPDRSFETDLVPAETVANEGEGLWAEDEDASWESVTYAGAGGRKDRSAATMLAALSPITLCVAAFLLWEPLMGGGDTGEANDRIISPVVAKYLDSKENGMGKFEVVAEMMTAQDKEKGEEGVVSISNR